MDRKKEFLKVFVFGCFSIALLSLFFGVPLFFLVLGVCFLKTAFLWKKILGGVFLAGGSLSLFVVSLIFIIRYKEEVRGDEKHL